MSQDAMLPCFVCGKTMRNAFPDQENQPDEGTEFRTYGHYGSTFWDSFNGEELVLNICDGCLKTHKDRLAQQKRFRPVKTDFLGMVGKHWVDRPMVPYTGNADDGDLKVEIEELGTQMSRVEWPDNIEELKAYALERDKADGPA